MKDYYNRTLFRKDNLEVLRNLNSNSIDLIATDPPFNKGKDFHATPDSLAAGAKFHDRWTWEKHTHQDWIDQLTDDHPRLMEAIESARYAHSDSMGAYMCYMSVRLLAMHRILKDTGSIYLHCDPTASHYLKAVMDAIFGWRNFRNEIVWFYKHMSATKRNFAKKHDLILWYSKHQSTWTFNIDDVREPYDPQTTKRYTKPVVFPGGHEAKPNSKGRVPYDVWEIPLLRNVSKERTGWPTQKPIKLYERIILASSNPGDIVLDPFAGCATTLVAAERHNRQWIGIDFWEKAYDVVVKRMKKEVGMFGEVKETEELPVRSDDGTVSVPFLRTKVSVKEPTGPRWTRADMYDYLLDQHGPQCQGCDRRFDDSRYLELDHNTPRSDGGLNHVTNRILLCGPCNKLKSNQYTLSGLRRQNRQRGYMAG